MIKNNKYSVSDGNNYNYWKLDLFIRRKDSKMFGRYQISVTVFGDFFRFLREAPNTECGRNRYWGRLTGCNDRDRGVGSGETVRQPVMQIKKGGRGGCCGP